MWAIAAIAVGVAAFVLWNAISPELPQGLRLPQPLPNSTVEPPPQPLTPVSVGIGPNRWALWGDGANWRLSREFLTPVRGEKLVFYPPALHLSCYGGRLYAWLDTRLAAREDRKHPGTVTVRVNQGSPQRWTQRERMALAAPRPDHLLKAMFEAPQLTLTLAFNEAPVQSITLATGGIGEFTSILGRCGGLSSTQ